MKKTICIFILWAACTLPSAAQQVLYSNLKSLLDHTGDTVTTLRVEQRSKTQIYMMGGSDFKIESVGNEQLSKYIKRRCYAVQTDTILYLNCRKMRYKNYRFGAWYAKALIAGKHVFFCAQPLGQAASRTIVKEEATKLGGEVGDAINVSGMVSQRVYYEVDMTTGRSLFVGKDRLKELFADRPDLLEAIDKETTEEASVVLKYLLQLR